MNRLYQEVSQRFIDSIEKYMDGQMSLDELKEVDRQEKLVYEYQSWETMARALRTHIFTHTKVLYDEINELDRHIRMVDNMCSGKEYDVDIDGVIAHSQMLGRNRMPPLGFQGSAWYVGPFPTLQMVDVLKNTDDDQESTADLNDESSTVPPSNGKKYTGQGASSSE